MTDFAHKVHEAVGMELDAKVLLVNERNAYRTIAKELAEALEWVGSTEVMTSAFMPNFTTREGKELKARVDYAADHPALARYKELTDA